MKIKKIPDNDANINFQLAFEMGVTMPLKVLIPIWNRDESTLCRLARQGKIPGAYKKGSSWWIWPRMLTEPVADKASVQYSPRKSTDSVRQRRSVS